MSDLIIVRSVEKTEYSQWQLLCKKYNSFYGRDSFPSEITQLTWSRFFDTNEPVYAVVAENRGKILGVAHYLFHRSTIQVESNCYLQDLYVSENMRGQGIARKLIEAVYKNAKAAGSKRVYWQTKGDNLVARKLYDKVAELSEFIVYRRDLYKSM